MMKATKKLVLRSEAVRILTSVELRAAAGGSIAGQLATTDSGAKACGTGPNAGSGDAACTTSQVMAGG